MHHHSTSSELTSKLALESAVIQENLKKYHQTEATCPLFQDDLYHVIGPCGNSPTVPDILKRGEVMVAPNATI